MAKTKLSSQDAIGRVHLAKIGYIESVGNEQQVLAAGTTITNTTGVISKDFGCPEKILLLLSATVAATFAIWKSIDNVKWFHDTADDVVFAAPADKGKVLDGANFIKVIPSIAQTGTAWVVATAIY